MCGKWGQVKLTLAPLPSGFEETKSSESNEGFKDSNRGSVLRPDEMPGSARRGADRGRPFLRGHLDLNDRSLGYEWAENGLLVGPKFGPNNLLLF